MSRARSIRRAVLAATLVAIAGRAHAAVDERPLVSLHVVASPAEARETQAVLADLLARIDIGIADVSAAKQASLVDVEIDLSADGGAPFVSIATRARPAIISRRSLSPQASRQVLMESAAEIAYAAVASHARALGILAAGAAGAPPVEPPNAPPAPADPTRRPEIAALGAGAAAALRAQPAGDPGAPGYRVDAATFAEMQLRGVGSSLSMAGGGAAVSCSLRRIRLSPAIALALGYLRAVAGEDPAAPADLSVVSARLATTVDALAVRWISLQLGPALAADVVRGSVPSFMPGPGPAMMMIGESVPFSGVALWAGGTARLSVHVGGRFQLFVATGADYQLRQAGPPAGRAGGPTGAPPPSGFAPSPWRSSLLAGLAFTVAGQAPTTD